MTSPLTHLQDWLDVMSEATIRADWETYREGADLPFHLVTDGFSLSITTEAELRKGFDGFVETLRTQKATNYIRIARSAEYVSPHLIAGGYESEILSHGTRIVAPYRSRVILRSRDGRWRAASIVNGLSNAKWPLLTPQVPAETLPDADTREKER
jgi:hypothetical protein